MKTNDVKWTPVSEGLPKESDLYIVSIDTKGTELETAYPDGLVYISIYDAVSMHWGHKKVIAWTQLPKPYRENDHDSN